jgi:SPP1 gp7 family putative phage head morphogenesis protein
VAVYSIPPVGPGWQLSALIARYRFSIGLEREVVAILEATYRDIARSIERASPIARTDRRSLDARFLEIRALLAEAYGTAQARVSPILREYAVLEAEVAARHAGLLQRLALTTNGSPTALIGAGGVEIARTIGAADGGLSVVAQGVSRQLVVSSARLADIVDAIDMGGIGFGEWWTRAKEDGILRVRRQIQVGLTRGLNPHQIAATIWRDRSSGGPNAWRQSRTVLHSAIRTVTTSIQNEAALTSEQSFADVIHAYEFQAILDARTSAICRSLDGTRYRVGDPNMPVPALHPHCRSTLVPVADLDGLGRQRSPRTSYDQWLREQSPATQNAILGRGIAEHYRAGRTTLSDLLSVDRRPLTLAQLRRALYATQPESYGAWVRDLSPSQQNAVLGRALADRLRHGTAKLDEVLAASARVGVIEETA